MGDKSKAAAIQVGGALNELKDKCTECDKKMDYFREQLIQFTDAPPQSPEKKSQSSHLEGISNQILPLTYRIDALIGQADVPLAAFERFLANKQELHKHDWTKLRKKSLQQYIDFVITARRELEAIRKNFIGTEINYQGGQIAKWVAGVVAHCKQAS